MALVARIIYWIAGFAQLGALIALFLHFFPLVLHDGANGEATTHSASWGLILVLAAVGIALWLLAHVLARLAASRWPYGEL